MKTSFIATLMLGFSGTLLIAEEPWVIESPEDWKKTQASASGITIEDAAIALDSATDGQWTSKWHSWQGSVDSAEIRVEAEIDLFDNKTIETVVDGSQKPYTDADGVEHDWYGRCMIAIVDENRWIMALRSGVNHISWNDRDTIHLITSTNEGRNWSKLDRWFDGTPIEGMPYEDGFCHSEPGLFRMTNGDLILQFWRTAYSSGTKQLRSTDNGKTWATDIDRISVLGVPGADDDMAIGTEDYFVDPENPSDVYMAFQYYQHHSKSGTLLARSRDNCKSYSFVSWLGPLTNQHGPHEGPNFEPAIEYVGNRTIVAVLRGLQNKRTWQTVSTNMGASFSPPVDISAGINGGIPNGLWQRTRLYKESNPFFQCTNQLDFARGEGRLWGFGLHSMGGGYTRKPVVYWSDDNGQSWLGPELLHGPMHPGTDTGYGDLKRRVDGTFVAATYYCPPGSKSSVADLEQYTFGGEKAQVMIEADRNGDGAPDANSAWREVRDGQNAFSLSDFEAAQWRLRISLNSTETSGSPKILRVKIAPL